VEEQKSVFEDSPIFGVLSKVAPEPVMKNVENASTEDVEGFGNWSPVLEIANEINSASEDQEVAAVEVPKEAIKEDDFSLTVEAADAPNKIILADVAEKEVAADELPQADPRDDDSGEEHDLNGESSDEADLTKKVQHTHCFNIFFLLAQFMVILIIVISSDLGLGVLKV
jgi:hypothetical protein